VVCFATFTSILTKSIEVCLYFPWQWKTYEPTEVVLVKLIIYKYHLQLCRCRTWENRPL